MHVSRLTLVALYGSRPAVLTSLVSSLQDRFALDGVRPRPLPDVHATVVGLETGDIDVAGLCSEVTSTLDAAPLDVRFGFPDRDLAVTSRDQRLYARTITVTADKVVLIGWPVDGAGEPTNRLDELRRDLTRFGARHRYGTDPDCYLVVADLLPGVDLDALRRRAAAARAELAAAPCRTRLSAADVGVATYVDPRLPAASTRFRPLRPPG